MVILRGRRQQDHVNARPTTNAPRSQERCGVIGSASDLRTASKRKLALAGIKIDAHDAAPIGAAQLNQELPEQTETNYRYTHAQFKACLSQPLERDGADCAGTGCLETYV